MSSEIAVEADVADSQRELGRPQLLVARAPRRVDPDERRDRGCEEEERAADLRLQERPQRRGDVPPPGRALRQRTRGLRGCRSLRHGSRPETVPPVRGELLEAFVRDARVYL